MMDNYGTPGADAGARRGRVRLGHRRQPLPRPARRHRGQRARPRAPGDRRGGDRADRQARPHLEPLHQPPRARSSPSGCSTCPVWTGGRVLFCNSGAEANEAALKLTRRTGRTKIVADRRRLPRPHDGRARADRPARQAHAVRAAGARRRARPVRRRRPRWKPRSTTRPPRSSSSRSRARTASSSRRRATCRRPARITAEARRAAGPRRGADRRRPRSAPGSPSSRPASCRTWSRWPRASAAGCRSARASAFGHGRGPVRARPARHHVRRQPGVLRRGARGARHDRRGRPAGARRRGRQGDRRRRRGSWTTRSSPGCGAPACCSASRCARRSRRRPRRPRSRPVI